MAVWLAVAVLPFVEVETADVDSRVLAVLAVREVVGAYISIGR